MRRFLLAAAVFSIAGPALAAPQLSVAIDHVERLNLSRPAGSVIVGNPAVADVTVVDQHTLFVSGRGYGVSEIVVLDPLGRTVWNGEVVVTESQSGQVSVYRGANVTEMACAGACSPSVRAAKSGASGGGSSGGGASGGAAKAPASGGGLNTGPISNVPPSPGL